MGCQYVLGICPVYNIAMSKKSIALLCAIMALGAFLRFYQITEIPPGLYPDEAMNGNNALEALATGDFKVFYPENNGREGLFINMQAISVAAFGNTPWALRIVSALIGTLTILGIYLVARELFRSNPVGLLAAFFLAASYWHLNFSRIGFRAIMLPMFATFGIYFLLKGLRTCKALNMIIAGTLTGLGVHTYIAFRFMVFVFAVPIVYTLWQRMRVKRSDVLSKTIALFTLFGITFYIIAALVALAPLGFYFFQHPEAFASRAGDVSVFSSAAPAKELLISAGKTVGMFFWNGDCNWRHNFICRPELNPLVAVFFVIGIIASIRASTTYKLQSTTLAVWLIAMSLPAVLTREGIPHALRAIGMLPPVMILAGLGADRVRGIITAWSARQKSQWLTKAVQIERIRRELTVLLIAALLTVPLITYRDYFIRWADKPQTYDAFDASSVHLGKYLAALPRETHKYVAVNRSGTLVGGRPPPPPTHPHN